MASLAGPSLPPSPCGPSHVHPHLAHAHQLPQHQADGGCVTPSLLCRPALLAMRALVGSEERAELSSPAWQGGGLQQCSGLRGSGARWARVPEREGAAWRRHRSPEESRAHVLRLSSTAACHVRSSLWPHSQMGTLKPEARKALPEPHPGSSAAPRCLTPAAGALTAAPSSAAPSAARAPCWETSQPSE